MSKRWWCRDGNRLCRWGIERVREVEKWEDMSAREWGRQRARRLGKGVRVVERPDGGWSLSVDCWARLSRCHDLTKRERERERGGETKEMEVGRAGLLEAENRNGERGGRKLKWANGKGKCKIGYLYLGFIRVF